MSLLWLFLSSWALADEPSTAPALPAEPTPVAAPPQAASADPTSAPFTRVDPNLTRTMYAQTAFAQPDGRLTLSQRQLLFTVVSYGVTDRFTVSGGGVPVYTFGDGLLSGLGPILLAGVKYAGPVGDKVRLGAGLSAVGIPQGSFLAYPYLVTTIGDEHRNVSVCVIALGGIVEQVWVVPSVSGYWRVRDGLALVAESHAVGIQPSYPWEPWLSGVLPTAGVRMLRKRVAIELGLMVPAYGGDLITPGLPIPWVDFTWAFHPG